jgi:hypothetical protein
MGDIFISYAQAERQLMLPFKARLEALGLQLFVDVDGPLDEEQAFPDALDKGVKAAKAVLACWTPWALSREWVKNECAIARDRNQLVAMELQRLSDVPAEFYRIERKNLVGFSDDAPHEGWAATLSALAKKLRLWLRDHSDHADAARIKESAASLEQAARVERERLKLSEPKPPGPPSMPIESPPSSRTWKYLVVVVLVVAVAGAGFLAFNLFNGAAKPAIVTATTVNRVPISEDFRIDAPAGVEKAIWSPQGDRVAFATKDRVFVYTAIGDPLKTFDQSVVAVAPIDLAFSPEGRRLVVATGQSGATLYDVVMGSAIGGFVGPEGITSVSWGPNADGVSAGLANGQGDADLTLQGPSYDITTDYFSDPPRAAIRQIIWGSDNERSAVAADDGAVMFMYMPGTTKYRFELGPDHGFRVAFSPDGNRLLAPADNRTAKVWDIESGEIDLTLSGHGGPVLDAQFSRDGARIATSSADGRVRIWDAVTGELRSDAIGLGESINTVAFSPDDKRLLVASSDGTVRAWRIGAD